MADLVCKHERKRLIAKDDDSQYWECLDCGEILEAAELVVEPSPRSTDSVPDRSPQSSPQHPTEPSDDPEKQPASGESLSDA